MVNDNKAINKSVDNKRLLYIDMCKGLLIIMVMIGHMQNVCKELGVQNDVFTKIDHLEWFWGPFFMPAFFVITGFCSNFNKPFRKFLISNIKGILIPSFTLGVIASWIGLLYASDLSIGSFFHWGIRRFLISGGYWFLAALFLSKLSYYWIKKINNRYTISVLLIIMHILGYLLFTNSICYNIWFFQHAMMLTLYLHVGQCLKELQISIKNKTLLFNWVAYIALVSIVLLLGYESPHIAHNVTINDILLIPHLIFSVWGAYMIMQTAKCFKEKSVLIYLGQNSLIYYCIHIKFLFFYIIIYRELLNGFSILYWVLTIVSVILSCTIVSKLLNTKYLKILLGKF